MTPNAPATHDPRFDADGDWLALQFFTPDDLRRSPEEYVARHAHTWGCFSFHLYRYQDAVLGAWVRRVGELLFAEEELERCREQFLTPSELASIRHQMAQGF